MPPNVPVAAEDVAAYTSGSKKRKAEDSELNENRRKTASTATTYVKATGPSIGTPIFACAELRATYTYKGIVAVASMRSKADCNVF